MSEPTQINVPLKMPENSQEQAYRILTELQHNAARIVKQSTTLSDIRNTCRSFFGQLLSKNKLAMSTKPVLIEEAVERMLLLHEFCLIRYTQMHAAELELAHTKTEKEIEKENAE